MHFGMQMAPGMPMITLPELPTSVMDGGINQDSWQVLQNLAQV